MDKLRALEYFVAAAEERSLSGAARRLDVSVPAVSKLIGALEHILGAPLFDRTAQGLTLTSNGETYLRLCHPLLDELAAADEALRGESSVVRGTLIVGSMQMIAQHCLVPALPRLHARCPELQIDIRDASRPTDADTGGIDIYLVWGWMDFPTDLVQRTITHSKFLICAAPGYWAKWGVPETPRDLERHNCFVFRIGTGTVHDLWQFERNGMRELVPVTGWLTSSHRDVALDLALAGEGVVRLTDLTILPHVRSGRLVPVLLDWEMPDAPPLELLYKANQRRNPRVRLFIDFVTEVFSEIDSARGGTSRHAERPRWWARRGRASAAIDKHG